LLCRKGLVVSSNAISLGKKKGVPYISNSRDSHSQFNQDMSPFR
jgi:hypothetical protein